MWTRAVTQRGVAIDIGSPASDPLGRAGVTGKIDRFFWQRFGAAMLFSVLDAGGQIAGQAVSPQGSTVFRTPGDSTSQILQDTQNIRPIVRVNQGTELAINDATDFDFRSEEHTSELQSLMRISHAVFCLKKNNKIYNNK